MQWKIYHALEDLGGAKTHAPAPLLYCFHSHVVFGKDWPNSSLKLPPSILEGYRSFIWEILDPPLNWSSHDNEPRLAVSMEIDSCFVYRLRHHRVYFTTNFTQIIIFKETEFLLN